LEAAVPELLGGEIEIDESYFGGVRKGKRGRGASSKVPVFACRINHRERFVDRQRHINGIENFWNQPNAICATTTPSPASAFPSTSRNANGASTTGQHRAWKP
jgi:transposase